jgi:hypothetical protein
MQNFRNEAKNDRISENEAKKIQISRKMQNYSKPIHPLNIFYIPT